MNIPDTLQRKKVKCPYGYHFLGDGCIDLSAPECAECNRGESYETDAALILRLQKMCIILAKQTSSVLCDVYENHQGCLNCPDAPRQGEKCIAARLEAVRRRIEK